jgi:hypothetical protein
MSILTVICVATLVTLVIAHHERKAEAAQQELRQFKRDYFNHQKVTHRYQDLQLTPDCSFDELKDALDKKFNRG